MSAPVWVPETGAHRLFFRLTDGEGNEPVLYLLPKLASCCWVCLWRVFHGSFYSYFTSYAFSWRDDSQLSWPEEKHEWKCVTAKQISYTHMYTYTMSSKALVLSDCKVFSHCQSITVENSDSVSVMRVYGTSKVY